MGKRLIRRGISKAKGCDRGTMSPSAGDFGESSDTGELQSDVGNVDVISSNNNHSEYADPGDFHGAENSDSGGAGTNADGSPRKRRGRRKGWKKATAEAQTSLTTKLLFSIHAMGATFTATPELMLTLEESEKLAQAIAEVQKHYPLFELTEKQEAWIGLGMAATAIYGPRLVAIVRNNKTKKMQQKQQAQPATIFTMPDLETLRSQGNGTEQKTPSA